VRVTCLVHCRCRSKSSFMGSDPIALPLLDWLIGEGSATAASARHLPPSPTGRRVGGKRSRAGPIKQWASGARRTGPPAGKTFRRGTRLARGAASRRGPGHGLRPRLERSLHHHVASWLAQLHASLLPKYRGASPIQTAWRAEKAKPASRSWRIVKKARCAAGGEVEAGGGGAARYRPDVERKLAAACVPLLAALGPSCATAR